MFVVPSELHILKKELFNNWYKLSTYFMAFLITNMPLQVSGESQLPAYPIELFVFS